MFGWFRKRSDKAEFLRSAGETSPEQRAETAMIEACRQRFGPPPREMHAADRVRLSPDLQKIFEDSKDGLLQILQDQEILLTCGQVVWGQLLQANQILFQPTNKMTLPANVIYSMDPFFDGRLSLLSSMARGLFAQKGSTSADREIQGFVNIVTDEMTRVLRREMPHSYTGGRSVNFAICFIQPSHLPDGHIVAPSFPIIVSPEETPTMMVLPSRYWPAELIAQWRQ